MVDCCAPMQVPGAGLRLEERSDEYVCGFDKFKLYECPSCGALWVAHDAFWDHGTWYRKAYVRVPNVEGFEEFLASVRAAEVAARPDLRERKPLTATDIARAFRLAATIGRESGSQQNG